MQPPVHQNMSTSHSSPMMPLGQKHPLAFQTQVPASASSSAVQQVPRNPEYPKTTCYRRSDQDEWVSNEGKTRDFYASLPKTHSCCPEAFHLVLRMEGELYKRRSKSLSDRKAAMEASRSSGCTSTFSCLPKHTWFATICPYDRAGDSTPSVHENTLPADLWAIEYLARLSSSYVIRVQCRLRNSQDLDCCNQYLA